MHTATLEETKEKKFVTMTSVIAAIFLTATKLIVGIMTGSLGILSEALHSGLDLIAAVMTYFAVKLADTPPDENHNYGHGKIENLSALFETLLLLITCIWIIYEATERILFDHPPIEVNIWSFSVIILSIIIDISRSRALMRVAKKYNNQAIEADALHFSTDILSSAVVLVGLAGSYFFDYHEADSIAALFVGLIVVGISYRIGKKSIDALLDKKPDISSDRILEISKLVEEIKWVHDIKLRTSGSQIFIDLNIHVDPELKIGDAHFVAHRFESLLKIEFERASIHIHIEPDKFYNKGESKNVQKT